MIGVLLAVCLGARGGQSIDACAYLTDAEAQANWEAYDGALPARTGAKGIRLPFDLRGEHARAYWDHKLDIDLSRVDRLSFDFYISDTAQITPTFNCYFQSAGGWFAASFPAENGWNHVSLSKASFRTEDTPAGWNRVTTMRVGGWKSVEGAGEMGIANIEAHASDVAVILGDKTKQDSPEFGTVQGQAQVVTKVLEAAGIPCGGLTDSEVEAGALEGRKIAVFPHNPDMTDKEMDQIERFVNGGGRVIGFYAVHPRLLKLIGAQNQGWKKAEFSGFFATMRFGKSDIRGLPATVKQASWNAYDVRPIRDDAKVIGEWFTSANDPTGLPAWVASKTGAYMSHVLLADDSATKSRMMLALLGHFHPDLWKSACDKAETDFSKIGPFRTVAEARSALGPKAVGSAEQLAKRAALAKSSTDYALSIKLFGDSREALIRAYCASVSSKANEMRAAWCHSAFGIGGLTWDAALAGMRQSGLNAIFPNMLWAGRAYYPSKLLPVDESVAKQGDPIANCLEAARKNGLKMHVWKVNWNLLNAPTDFLNKMRAENRTQKDPNGKDVDWLCPSHPLNFQLEHDSMMEVVKNYAVDGIHFDYIRYPGSEGCYCGGCKERFEEIAGAKISNWPWDVINGPLKAKYRAFRRANISKLVRAVSRDAREARPGIQLSAAVFADWPVCRDTVGQDWVAWVKDGTLDFVCPMNYTSSATQYEQFVKNQFGAMGASSAFRPGIGATLDSTMTPDQVVRQITLGRKHGSSGFILFNLDENMLRNLLPFLRLGATSK